MLENNSDVLVRLLEENQRLLQANHELLKKMNKRARVDFWIKVAIYTVVLILPLLLLPYLMSGLSAITGNIVLPGNNTTSSNTLDSAAILQQLKDLTK